MGPESRSGTNDFSFVKPLGPRSSHFSFCLPVKTQFFGWGNLVWFLASGDWGMPAEGFERSLTQLRTTAPEHVGEP